MIAFDKPDIVYNYQLASQLLALYEYQLQKPGRAIPKKEIGKLLVANWNISNLGLQERREKDYRIIAHEYGHGFATEYNFIQAPSNPLWAEEYFSDANATILTVLSAFYLDALPPEFALSAGNFVLGCLEVLQRAELILKNGLEFPNHVDSSHLPNREHVNNNITTFRQFFDVKYIDKRICDLKFIPRKEPSTNHAFVKEQESKAYFYSSVLLIIWSEIRELLMQHFKSKRQLHAMWN